MISVTKIETGHYRVASDRLKLGEIQKRADGSWRLTMPGSVDDFPTFLQARNAAFKAGKGIEPRLSATLKVTRVEPTEKAQPVKPYKVRPFKGRRAGKDAALRPYRYGLARAALAFALFAGAYSFVMA